MANFATMVKDSTFEGSSYLSLFYPNNTFNLLWAWGEGYRVAFQAWELAEIALQETLEYQKEERKAYYASQWDASQEMEDAYYAEQAEEHAYAVSPAGVASRMGFEGW